MKDIRISATRQRKELKVFIRCFVIACSVNLIAIINFKTSFIELFSSIGYVVVFALLLYVLFVAIRLVLFLFRTLFFPGKLKSR